MDPSAQKHNSGSLNRGSLNSEVVQTGKTASEGSKEVTPEGNMGAEQRGEDQAQAMSLKLSLSGGLKQDLG